jgi:predicted ATPase/DNA-binding winged helix-turn-helix (wHTH) protein
VPTPSRQSVYQCGPWEIDPTRRELRSRGVAVPIGGRAFEIVEVLVRSAGDLVTKDDLMDRVWRGAIVEDNTLQVHISAVRKALGPDRGMLKTASGRGYRLLGSWTARQERASEDTSAVLADPGPSEALDKPFLTNFPAATSDLIGRVDAVLHLWDLSSAYRLVTLTGPGGIGKTALALEVARALFPGFRGDASLVELAALSDPGLVPSAVASVLGLKLGGAEISAEAVARSIGGRKLLLVLDNCEHVIDAAARLAEAMVRLCPRTSLLATSREALRIEGECIYRVPPLDVPPVDQEEPDNVLEHSAVQLFITRTRASHSDYSPSRDDVPAIAAICRHLDGIPLAIEFAAARTAALGLEQVASRLEDRFAILTGGRRTALPRQQTLRATLDWSYEILPDSEKCLLRRLGVFAGGFNLEAATAVMGDSGNTASAVVEGIANLVAKSLVTYDGLEPAGRWRLLETIRAYALEQLAESGEAAQAARHHAEYFRDLVALAASGAPAQPAIEDMTRYIREIENVRAALDWSFSPVGDLATGVVLTAAYAPVWLHSSLAIECRERAERALDYPGFDLDLSASLRLRLYMSLAVALIITMGPVERTRVVAARAFEIAESLNDLDAQLRALFAQWSIHYTIGECHAARSIADQFSRVAHRTGDHAIVLVADRFIANTLQYGGKPREAQDYLERVLELYAAPKNQRDIILFQYDQRALARAMLARVLWLQGHVERANEQAQASLDEAQAADHGLTLCWVLHYAVCPIKLMTGDLVAADRAVAMLVDRATSLNAAFWKIVGRCLEGKLSVMRGDFEAATLLLRTALDTCDQTEWRICYPEFMGALAEGLAGSGQPTEALATVDQGLATAERGGERWYVAELLRIKGELLLQKSGDRSVSAAEASFVAAIELAREQGALFWELRAALSLTRLRINQDRPNEARQILAPVYDRSTGGLETADLRAARGMLESLPILAPRNAASILSRAPRSRSE